MKNARTNILAILVLASACLQNAPADAEQPIVSADASPVNCLDAPQAGKTLPYKPTPCAFPKSLTLGGELRTVDFAGLKETIEGVATQAVLNNRGPRCVDGCEFSYYAGFVPKLKAFLASGRSYEKARDCKLMENNTSFCSSGPDEWTNRGWAYFIRDFLLQLDSEKINILDGNEVSVVLVKDYLSE